MRETLIQLLRNAVAEEPDIYPSHLAVKAGAIILQNEIVDTSRWAIINEVVFEKDFGDVVEYVRGTYSEGATEMQDDIEKDWEFQPVRPVIVETTVYERIFE